jgi:pyridoxamine 5'-phosphate oxidase
VAAPADINPSNLRRNYARGHLLESEVSADPFSQFAKWFAEAQEAGFVEPNAMTLATADASGAPSARVVLLKGVHDGAFTFFTSYISRKGKDLDANSLAALLFYWDILERQIRIEGRIERTSSAENERYFHSRPRKSQISAAASRQSQPIGSRMELEKLETEIETRYEGSDIPLPDFWGGYRLIPATIEFWQGRTGRLHDRLVYTREGNSWKIGRLQP